jgi:hypothetical protein
VLIGGNNITFQSRFDLLITKPEVGVRGVMLGLLPMVLGASLEVAYLIWKSAHLNSVVASLEAVDGEFELGIDIIPLHLRLVALVIKALVMLDLHNGIPAVLISDSLVKGVKGGTRTNNEVIEPGWH